MGMTTGTWITENQDIVWIDSSRDWEVQIIKGAGSNAAMAICLQTNNGSLSQTVGEQTLYIVSEVPFTVKVRISAVEGWEDYTPTLTTRYYNRTYYYILIHGRNTNHGSYTFKNMPTQTGWFTVDNDVDPGLTLSVIQNMLYRLEGPYVPHGEGSVTLDIFDKGESLTFESEIYETSKTQFVDDDMTIDFRSE